MHLYPLECGQSDLPKENSIDIEKTADLSMSDDQGDKGVMGIDPVRPPRRQAANKAMKKIGEMAKDDLI